MVSEKARRRSDVKKTSEGSCVHSFRTLVEGLGTLSLNEVSLPGSPDHRFCVVSEPAAVREKAFELLGCRQRRICSQ